MSLISFQAASGLARRMHSRQLRSAAIGFVAATAALTLGPASADARARKCTRGATLVAASGTVRIVRVKLQADPGERYEKLLGCRTTNGRRFTLLYEAEVPDELYTETSFTVVGDRYIGAIARFTGAVREGASAMVWDTRTRRLIHSSRGTCRPSSSTYGIFEAVFLLGGGMAYRCDQAGLFLADADGNHLLESADVNPADLAASGRRLYWTVSGYNGEPIEVRSLVLSAGR
jgi:hypothetical protein